MVPDVEKLGPELEAVPLVQWKGLEKREIRVLESRSPDDVASRVAKRPQHPVGGEGARVEESSGNAWFGSRIANAIRMGRMVHIAVAIGAGEGSFNISG